MFCSKCGMEIPEDTKFCPNCGEKVSKDIDLSDVKAYAEQNIQKASAVIQDGMESFKQIRKEVEESRKIGDVSEIFASPDETQRAVIGGGYLDNLLSGGGMSKGFGVLTDRRLYYRGKSYYKLGGRYVKSHEDCTVDLPDISSSGFIYTKRLWSLVLAVCSLIISLSFGLTPMPKNSDKSPLMLCMLLFLIVAIVSLLIYLSFDITMYTITFAGGCLGINVSFFGINEVRDFDKTLHRVKDECLTSSLNKG